MAATICLHDPAKGHAVCSNSPWQVLWVTFSKFIFMQCRIVGLPVRRHVIAGFPPMLGKSVLRQLPPNMPGSLCDVDRCLVVPELTWA